MSIATMSRRGLLSWVICIPGVLILASGCQWPQPPAPTPAPAAANLEVNDVCAERLHDLCGQLFLYYSRKHVLPQSLEELAPSSATPSSMPSARLVCPVSGKPYVYDRAGLEVPGSDKLVIVYDPTPCQGGKRHVIVIDRIRPGKPLTTDVKLFSDGPMFAPK